MFPFKVEYIYCNSDEKKGFFNSKSPLDLMSLSKELEALLVEYKSKGYELVNITPIQAIKIIQASYAASYTEGLIVTFRQVES